MTFSWPHVVVGPAVRFGGPGIGGIVAGCRARSGAAPGMVPDPPDGVE